MDLDINFACSVTINSLCFCCLFQNLLFQKILFGAQSVSNRMNPDQDQCCVSPDLEPNCLQCLSTDDKSKESSI